MPIPVADALQPPPPPEPDPKAEALEFVRNHPGWYFDLHSWWVPENWRTGSILDGWAVLDVSDPRESSRKAGLGSGQVDPGVYARPVQSRPSPNRFQAVWRALRDTIRMAAISGLL